jgi:hypothetical protein
MKPRTFLTLLTTLVALAVPASAQAITVSGTATPADLTAGANSDFAINMTFGGAGGAASQVQDLTVSLPPGVVGDPTATPKCTVAELNADACAANTQVGEVSAMAALLGVPLPIAVTGELYNLVPQPGEPARFGIVLHPDPLNLLPEIILQSGAALRNSDFGLDTVINDIPNTTLIAGDTTILSQSITLYGSRPWMSKPFMRNPTSCDAKVASFRANDHADPNTFVTADAPPFTPTNCGALPFSPTFNAKITVPGQVDPDTKPTLVTAIDQDNGEAGLRNAQVLVPPALSADLNELLPSEVCSIPSFQASSCPANSVIGSAVATSPLLTSPLTGPVIVVDNPGGVAKVGLDLKGELNMQIQGQLALDNSTTFIGLPDIPIAHFELTFNGGPGGLLSAGQDLCKIAPPVFHTDFLGHNGATVAADTPSTVEGCGPPRSPQVTVKLKRPGSETPKLVVRAKSESKFLPLAALRLKLPKGLSFAKGKAFGKGVKGNLGAGSLPDSAVKASRRKLRLTLRNGANDLSVKIAKGALLRTGRLKKGKLSFPVALRDLQGKSTALRVRP